MSEFSNACGSVGVGGKMRGGEVGLRLVIGLVVANSPKCIPDSSNNNDHFRHCAGWSDSPYPF